MPNHQGPCKVKRLVGHLVWHEVSFIGPGTTCPGNLPENGRGDVDHLFVNGSIYPQTFVTTVSTQPGALAVVGLASPPAVLVPQCTTGPIRTKPSTGTASQVLEHLPDRHVGLPHTATASFTTSVTPGWATSPAPSNPGPSISVVLTR
jgi:hypothetical protein